MTTKAFDTQKLVLLAILTAIVIALQILAIVTRLFLPMFSLTLVLVPIVTGAALIGIYAGAWLGLVFGFAVLISGDANIFLGINFPGTIIVVLLKGLLAGFAAGVVYKLINRFNRTIAVFAAAIVCPLVNTGIFILGCYIFFLPELTHEAILAGAASVTAFIFFIMIGVNFLIEFGVNIVLSPSIVRLIQYRRDLKTKS